MSAPEAARGPLRALDPVRFPWFDYSRYTFSLGLTDGARSWLSGHSASAYDPDERRIVVRGGMTEQAATAYEKILAILEAAGHAPGDVHRVVEYVTAAGIDAYAEAEHVRREVFGRHSPAVCTVVVNRLLRPQALIEVEVTSGPDGRALPGGALATDGLVYLPSITAPGDDLVTQTGAAFERVRALLEGAGLNLSNVVKTVDYTTPATLGDYKRTGRVRASVLGPVFPAAAGILLSRLQTPGALVSLDVIASRHPAEAVNPGWERYSKLTYSPAVRAGDVLLMSGQAALDPETERAVHPGGIAAQAGYTYRNIIAVLEAAGLGPEHLVKTIEYVTPAGLPRYREVAAVRERLLCAPFPASTGAVCEALLRPEFEIEIDPTAVFPS